MTGPELQRQFLVFISTSVTIQLVLVCAIAFMTLILLFFRRWRQGLLAKWDLIHSEFIIQEMLDAGESDSAPLLIRPSAYAWFKNQSMRDSLLRHLNAVSGSEKKALIERYRQLGFIQNDLKQCYSRSWARRLAAISRLQLLELAELAPVFHILSADRDDFVASTALLALSGLRHEINVVEFKKLRESFLSGRRSLLIEILSGWSQVHGFEQVFALVKNHPERQLRSAMIEAILSLKTPESSGQLSEILAQSQEERPELIVRLIRGLREIGDPLSIDGVASFLNHADETVRQVALELILLFDAMKFESAIESLRQDPSPGIQRLLRAHVRRSAA